MSASRNRPGSPPRGLPSLKKCAALVVYSLILHYSTWLPSESGGGLRQSFPHATAIGSTIAVIQVQMFPALSCRPARGPSSITPSSAGLAKTAPLCRNSWHVQKTTSPRPGKPSALPLAERGTLGARVSRRCARAARAAHGGAPRARGGSGIWTGSGDWEGVGLPLGLPPGPAGDGRPVMGSAHRCRRAEGASGGCFPRFH